MSYSQLVLSQRPYGYWDCSSIVSGELEDLTSYNNHAEITNVETMKKPIIYGPSNSVKLSEDSEILINNVYKLFMTGAEEKPATLELFFNIKDSSTTKHEIITIGNFISCYIISDKIFIQYLNKKASLQVSDWDSTQYLCLKYNNNSIAMYLNDSDPVAISLGENFTFPDSTPPNILIGPSATRDLNIYINSIALYSYALLDGEIYQRLSWAGYSSKSDRLAIINNAEILNPIISDQMISMNYNLLQKSFISQGISNNVIINNESITLRSIPPVFISSTETTLNYDIDQNGLELGGGSFIKLNNIAYCFNGYNNIISQQVLLDGLTTKQTIFSVGPFLDQSILHLYKATNNKFVLSKESWQGVEEILAQSADLGSDYTLYFNVAVAINDGYVTLVVDDYESSASYISTLSNNYEFYLGNSFENDSPLTSKIKNFSINKYSEDILFTETGNYTLKFNNSFNVSQSGTWDYQLSIPANSISSFISYNYACKNIAVYVNDQQIMEPTFVPYLSYFENEQVSISVKLISSDSITDIPELKNLSVKFFDSCHLSSANGIYNISPLSVSNTDTYVKINPYIIKNLVTSPLAKNHNLGIKFVAVPNYINDYLDDSVKQEVTVWNIDPSIETSGACLYGNKPIKVIEFIIQLDRDPGYDEEFTILNVKGSSIKLSYDKDGIILSSGYSLYIDGTLCVGGENLLTDEVYYATIVFSSEQTSQINLGIDNTQSNGMSGSMGFFAIHKTAPSNITTYISARKNSIFGRSFLSKLDVDQLNISDLPENTQDFYRSPDGKYFEMIELPKVKIVQNKWETIK